MSIKKFFGDLTSKHTNSDYRVIRSSIPVTITPDRSSRDKIIELFNQYSQHETVFSARYIGSNKISDPRDTQLVHVAIDLVRDAKRSMGGKKRRVEIHMKLGNGIAVFDDGELTLKLRFPVYKLVYASRAPDNKKVFVFICDISGKGRKGFRMYAFKSDEKTSDSVVKTLKEMYYVVHKIHRAKRRKKRALEKQKESLPTESPVSPSDEEPKSKPLSAYLSELALDEHSGIFPTTFASTQIPNVTSELDSMIEELALETKSLQSPQYSHNPFVTSDSAEFAFDDNFGQVLPSPDSKSNNRVSFYDAFSNTSEELTLEPTPENGAKKTPELATTPDLGASSDLGATPSYDDEFISIAKRSIPCATNGSGSRGNSFSKLFQRERSGSYTKLDSSVVPISPETETNGKGIDSLTLANPFSDLEISNQKQSDEQKEESISTE